LSGSNETDERDRRARDLAPGPGDPACALSGLRRAVLHDCRRNPEWPAKVAAGICAALEFAATDLLLARLLTIDAVADRPGGDDLYRRMVTEFAELLRAEAPTDKRLPVTTDEAVVDSIARLIGVHLRAGRQDELVKIGPDLAQLALLPYLGFDEARRWADSLT